MANARPRSGLPRTLEEFEAWHARQPERWEFIHGVPKLMAPASNAHSLVKGNLFAALRTRLQGGPCRVLVDGPQVKARDLSTIPDIVVVCGRIDLRSGTVDEPVLIAEILSPSTEDNDLIHKWQSYCLIPSLQHFLTIAQDRRFVMVHTRTGPSAFEERAYEAGSIVLGGLGAELSVEEIYEGIDVPDGAQAAAPKASGVDR
jgi:Uma2 family endonuclease